MAEEVKPDPSKPGEPKPESKVNADEIRTAVVAGVSEAMKAVLESASAQGAGAASQQSASASTPEPEPTTDAIDAEIDAAAAEGKPIGALMRRRDEIVEQRVRRRYVDPIASQGAAAISSLAADSLKGQPHLDRLKPTIDRLLSDPRLKGVALTPAHYQWAYNQARGIHYDEISKIDTENAIRRAAEPPEAHVPTGRGAATEPEVEDQNFAQRFGRGVAETFKRKNQQRKERRSEDDEARMQGFADRKEMMKVNKELEESEDFSLGLDR